MAKRPSVARCRSTRTQIAAIAQLPELLTVAEFMRATRLGRTTAYALVRDGSLPVVRFGRTVRIPRDVLKSAACQPA